MTWILQIAIYLFIFCLTAWLWQKLGDRVRRLPPGPFRFPGIGSIFQVLSAHKTYPFIAFQKLAETYGDIVYLQIGILDIVVINGYEKCKELLTQSEDFIGKSDEKWLLDRTFQKPLGLFCAHTWIWRDTRKFCSRTLMEFGFGKKSTMEVLVAQEVEEFCQRLKLRLQEQHSPNNNGSGTLRVNKLFNQVALNVAWSFVSGQRFDQDDPKLRKLVAMIEEYFQMGSFGAGPLTAYPFLVDLAPKLVRFDFQQKVNLKLQKFLKGLIDEIRVNRDPNEPKNFIEAFLDKMDEVKEVDPDNVIFSEENLISVLYDLFTGASETTGNLLSFSILYLALNPKVQQKVFEEIAEVVGANKLPSWKDKDKLPYTEATVLELYRMSNVVPIGPRKLFHDVQVGNYKIPKGTTALMNYYSVSMDKRIWGDPHEFRPERFLGAHGEIINADKIMPFSTGKRNCIGEQAARVTVFIGFAGIFQRFKFTLLANEPKPSTEPIPGLSLTPKPFDVHAEPRASSSGNHKNN